MAQTTKSKSKSSASRDGSRAKSSGPSKSAASKRSSPKRSSPNGKSAASKRSSSKRSSPNGNRAKSTTATRPRAQSRPKAQSRNGAGSPNDTVIDRAKGAGQAVANAASKAKTPLIAGGTALIGAAAGAAIKDRLTTNRSKNPLKRLSGVSMPKPAANLDPGKLNVKAVKSTAERVSAYAQQASDIAAAVEKTRKKNN